MRTTSPIFILLFASLIAIAGEPRLEPQMSLEERVVQARLIVIGKLGPPGDTGRHVTTSLRVEQTLFGSVPTNKTLFVSYQSTRRLTPEITSLTHVPKRGSRWIFFLTDEEVKQPPGTNYFTRAIGPYRYAHDGLELATEEVVKQVQGLVAKKKK